MVMRACGGRLESIEKRWLGFNGNEASVCFFSTRSSGTTLSTYYKIANMLVLRIGILIWESK